MSEIVVAVSRYLGKKNEWGQFHFCGAYKGIWVKRLVTYIGPNSSEEFIYGEDYLLVLYIEACDEGQILKGKILKSIFLHE